MKISKILLGAFIIFFVISCSKDDEKIELIQGKISKLNHFEKVQEAAKEVSLLEKKVGQSIINNEFIVGEIDQGKFVLAQGNSLQLLKKYYSLMSLKSGYNVEIKSFELITGEDNNGYSMLIANGVSKEIGEDNLKIAIDLIGAQAVFKLDGSGSSLVCQGCRRGCNPRKDSNGDGYCTDCKISNSSCTKTETVN